MESTPSQPAQDWVHGWLGSRVLTKGGTKVGSVRDVGSARPRPVKCQIVCLCIGLSISFRFSHFYSIGPRQKDPSSRLSL